MTDAAADDAGLRRTLLAGGGLLIASGAAIVATPMLAVSSVPLTTVVSWAGTIVFSVALLVFAFGLGRSASIVARRPLAVGAMLLLALWPFVDGALTAVVPYGPESAELYGIWGYVSSAVELAAAIVAVVQIARAGVVTGRVRWVPLWSLVAVVVPQLVVQLVVVALGIDFGRSDDDGLFLIVGLGQFAAVATPVLLGILAILRATRPVVAAAQRPSVQVYPPQG